MHVLLLKHASIAYKTVRLPAYCHSVTCDEIRALVKVFSNVSQKTVNVTTLWSEYASCLRSSDVCL